MELKEAQTIANEVLRSVCTHPDFGYIKDLMGRELDITDEDLDEAVGVLFNEHGK